MTKKIGQQSYCAPFLRRTSKEKGNDLIKIAKIAQVIYKSVENLVIFRNLSLF